ncbi:MAG TPA: oligosaccharide flippase family protein [Candidatus Sulfotelmatobacter sp.]|jgi:PST family polysaccharide transporter|nr:oligosaccharide flippase family protein [Candidatus Sulfotelmatobacter sp.]
MRNRNLGGIVWSAANGLFAVALPFLVFVGFTRLATPIEIGLVGICVSLVELLKTLAPQGLYEVLMQTDLEEHDKQATAAFLLLASGIVLAAAYLAIVGLALDHFVGAGFSPALLMPLALKLLFDVSVLQPQAALARRLAFRRLALRTMAANILAGIGGLALAALLTPLSGLVLYYVLLSFISWLTTVAGTQAAVPPAFFRPAFRAMMVEGLHASTVRLLAAANNYLDQVLIGTMVGAAAAGAYNVGKRTETVSITLASSFSSLLFQPLFAVGEPAQRRQHLRRGLACLTLVCGLPTAVVALWHQQLVPLVFGRQWADASAIVAFLCASGFARALGSVHGSLLSVSKRNRELVAYTLSSSVAGLAIVAVLGPIDIVWCVAALALKNILFLVPAGALTRNALPDVGRAYALCCVLPLLAATAGSYLAGHLAIAVLAEGALKTIGILTAAVLGAVAAGAGLLWPRIRAA